MKCYIDGIVAGNQSPFALALFISVKRHKLSCYVRENTSPTSLLSLALLAVSCCYFVCWASAINAFAMSWMHAICDIQQLRRAWEEEHVSPKELQLVPLPLPVPVSEQKKLLLAHIFVLVLALFAVAFVVVRLICDTFYIILVVASTKVCLLFLYTPFSLFSPSPFLLFPLRLKLLPLFHCQQDSQSHTDTHTLHVRILNMCASIHPCLCCCHSEACNSWPNRLRYARVWFSAAH